jgi:Zinc-binding dehydrogenase
MADRLRPPPRRRQANLAHAFDAEQPSACTHRQFFRTAEVPPFPFATRTRCRWRAPRGAHVIATVRGDADEARRLGAEEVYDSKAVEVIGALRASHPNGVDAVLDLVNGKDAIRRDAEILKAGGKLVSTLYAADEQWFAERKITAHNIASNKNPLSAPQG